MLKGLLYINNQDAYTTYGVFLTETGAGEHFNHDALLTPPAMKPYTVVSFREDDGEKLPFVLLPRFEARDVTLFFALTADTAERWTHRYTAFIALLKSGWLELKVTDVNEIYRMYCKEFTGFERLSSTTARFKVKFREPEPGI